MDSIFTFLDGAKEEFKDALAGKRTGGGFDGPPLPQNLQYRGQISRGEWRQAQTSGKWSFSMTFEVLEPEEFAGRKFTEYYSIGSDTNNIGREKLATLIGASGVDANSFDRTGDVEKDNAAFAKLFEGTQYVVAVRTWGDDMDRTGLRYLNKDYGQTLLTNVEPPKPKGGNLPNKKGGGPLKADISIPKGDDQTEEQPDTPNTEPDEQPQVTFPGGKSPSGVTLPPGLRK